MIGEDANTPGTFTMDGGSLTVANTVWISQLNGLVTGLWTMNGGTAKIGKLSLVNKHGQRHLYASSAAPSISAPAVLPRVVALAPPP